MNGHDRQARIERKTKETEVAIQLNLDGTGAAKVQTPIPFFSHMLEAWAKHGLMDLAVARKFPLGNGIITVNTEAQAWARARASELNKGGDAARAALAMLRIKRRLAKG